MEKNLILAINPGSTSTKIAVFEGESQVFITTLRHTAEEIGRYASIAEQFPFRKQIILSELDKAGVDTGRLVAVVGRGGLLRPIESGVYEVNERMIHDLEHPVLGHHASNLGGLIAHSIASSIPGAKAYIADPVVVDEMQDVARVTGLPQCQRKSIFHALNQKAIARTYAKSQGKRYEDLNLVIAHLGGGISVGAHAKGRVIDVNNALDGDGPFSPERAGTLPAGALADLCFCGEFDRAQISKLLCGKGGMVAHLGHNDAYKLEMDAKAGHGPSVLLQDALCYNVGKSIGAMATVLEGAVDAILLTGGIAHNPYLVDYVKRMVAFIAPVVVYAGEDEMAALAMNARMVLSGEMKPKVY